MLARSDRRSIGACFGRLPLSRTEEELLANRDYWRAGPCGVYRVRGGVRALGNGDDRREAGLVRLPTHTGLLVMPALPADRYVAGA